MEIEYPSAKIVVEVAKTQDKIVGDETTTTVIPVGELLREAEVLLNQNFHPSTIISGYSKAMEWAIKILRESFIP